jgi:hypothetical protein
MAKRTKETVEISGLLKDLKKSLAAARKAGLNDVVDQITQNIRELSRAGSAGFEISKDGLATIKANLDAYNEAIRTAPKPEAAKKGEKPKTERQMEREARKERATAAEARVRDAAERAAKDNPPIQGPQQATRAARRAEQNAFRTFTILPGDPGPFYYGRGVALTSAKGGVRTVPISVVVSAENERQAVSKVKEILKGRGVDVSNKDAFKVWNASDIGLEVPATRSGPISGFELGESATAQHSRAQLKLPEGERTKLAVPLELDAGLASDQARRDSARERNARAREARKAKKAQTPTGDFDVEQTKRAYLSRVDTNLSSLRGQLGLGAPIEGERFVSGKGEAATRTQDPTIRSKVEGVRPATDFGGAGGVKQEVRLTEAQKKANAAARSWFDASGAKTVEAEEKLLKPLAQALALDRESLPPNQQQAYDRLQNMIRNNNFAEASKLAQSLPIGEEKASFTRVFGAEERKGRGAGTGQVTIAGEGRYTDPPDLVNSQGWKRASALAEGPERTFAERMARLEYASSKGFFNVEGVQGAARISELINSPEVVARLQANGVAMSVLDDAAKLAIVTQGAGLSQEGRNALIRLDARLGRALKEGEDVVQVLASETDISDSIKKASTKPTIKGAAARQTAKEKTVGRAVQTQAQIKAEKALNLAQQRVAEKELAIQELERKIANPPATQTIRDLEAKLAATTDPAERRILQGQLDEANKAAEAQVAQYKKDLKREKRGLKTAQNNLAKKTPELAPTAAASRIENLEKSNVRTGEGAGAVKAADVIKDQRDPMKFWGFNRDGSPRADEQLRGIVGGKKREIERLGKGVDRRGRRSPVANAQDKIALLEAEISDIENVIKVRKGEIESFESAYAKLVGERGAGITAAARAPQGTTQTPQGATQKAGQQMVEGTGKELAVQKAGQQMVEGTGKELAVFDPDARGRAARLGSVDTGVPFGPAIPMGGTPRGVTQYAEPIGPQLPSKTQKAMNVAKDIADKGKGLGRFLGPLFAIFGAYEVLSMLREGTIGAADQRRMRALEALGNVGGGMQQDIGNRQAIAQMQSMVDLAGIQRQRALDQMSQQYTGNQALDALLRAQQASLNTLAMPSRPSIAEMMARM